MSHKNIRLKSPNLSFIILKQPLCFGGGISLPGTPDAPPTSFSPPELACRITAFQYFFWSFKRPIQQTPPRQGSSYSQLHLEDLPSLCHSSRGKYPAGSALKQEQPVCNTSQSQEIQLCNRKMGNTSSPRFQPWLILHKPLTAVFPQLHHLDLPISFTNILYFQPWTRL